MRKLIAAMKMSVDGRIEGPAGYADWVASWADEFGLTAEIDACVLGGRMYPNYETYWTSIQEQAARPENLGEGAATPAELDWARFAARTPHYVLSTSITTAQWPTTRFLTSLDELAALKGQDGANIYLMGGAQITRNCLEAGLLDELRVILYPLVAGEGLSLFDATKRHGLDLRHVTEISDGRVALTYTVTR